MTKLAPLFLAACAGAAPSDPGHTAITGDDITVEPDRLLVPVATHPEVAALAPGDYVAGTQVGGYFRSVVDVTTEGDRYAISTAEASVRDAIGSGDATTVYRTSDKPADGDGLTIEVTADKTRVYESDHFAVDLSAHVALQPALDLSAKIANGRIEQFGLQATGKLDATLGFDVTASAGDLISADKVLFTKQHVFLITVGAIPVPAVAELAVGVHVGATADAAITGHVDVGLNAQLSAGVRYDQQQWSASGDATVERYVSPVSISLQGGIDVTAYAYAELRVRLLDIAGPFVRIEPKLRFLCDIDGNYYRVIGIEADAGAEIELPMVDGAEKRFSAKVFEYNWW